MSGEPCLELLPLRWFVVKEADMLRLLADREQISPQFSELMIAGSAQSVYHRPGVVAEARRLAVLLDSLELRWPSAADVRELLERHPSAREHYAHDEDGERWYLRSPAIEGYERAFPGKRWCLLWQAPAGMDAVTVEGESLLAMMRLMPLLDGTRSLAQIIAGISGNEPARELLERLVRSGVVRERAAAGLEVDALPDFMFLGHSGLMVRDGRDLLLVDPIGRPDNEALGRDRPLFQLLNLASAVLISHHHWDHLDFQTLTRVRRDTPMIVPRCHEPSAANPPIAAYLAELGFVDVREHDPGDSLSIGALRLRLAEFRGEAFGLGSRFDAFTYHLRFKERSLYGTVDACHDEAGGMDETIREVASWGRPDLFLFGSSEQEHSKPYLAGGLRHFSNELKWRPELLRYHPDFADVARWARVLRPRWLIPYAQFLFGGRPRADLRFATRPPRAAECGEDLPVRHRAWLAQLDRLALELNVPIALLSAMQGIRD
ncbi:Beta-lactamase superfamily domain protein [Enhygromyxa salina]|uniref:Beta-lactamase superfamily domain protein n=1 Tax=Enhygromyxa salina TaxID=215803 RepID=A0A2S9YGV2_9BACT|nr:MBL fold metallo-hydrolase [Enhygromyxa salina]PRQ04330.1 Beta-lactamase superfamily domain protein [Enhygromyxa salina]